MANGNFVVQNGLTIGPLTIDAATGSISTTGNITTTGTTTTFINEIVTGTEAVYGQLSANSGATSTSTTTGAFQVVGGVGITGNVFVGGNIVVPGTGYVQVPAGTSAQRPGAASLGMIRYNSTISSFEGFGAGSAWSSLGGVKSVDGYATITAEASAGAGDDVLRFYSGSTGSSVQVMWASAGNISILPTTTTTSPVTGALQVAGGAGIAGSLQVGGTISAPTIGNTGATLTGTLSTAAQTNITSVGTLTGLTVSGAIVPNANVSVNLGSTSAWWNTIYGTAIHAQYADLAENYQADKQYNPGTVLMFGGSQEVTVATADTTAVAGVVSTNPAHLMNGALSGANVVALALTGRVPCNVIGPVAKGDLMVSAGFGFAKTNNTPQIGQVIGKALQDFPIAGKGVIEVVVGRF